jgi:hypothetical protein
VSPEAIVHIYNELVTLVHFNHWQGPLAIDTDDLSIKETIRVGRDPSNIEIIGNGLSLDVLEKTQCHHEAHQQATN